MSKGKLILGIAAGAAAGAILGVLFAPDKGAKTRKKIMGKGDDLKNKFSDLVDDMSGKFDLAKKETKRVAAKAKQKVKAMKPVVHHAAHNHNGAHK